VLKIAEGGFISKGYDLTQRAYVVEASVTASGRLEMALYATEESPVVNACLVLEGWNSEEAEVRLDGRILKKGDYKTGVIRNLERDDLVLWLPVKSVRPLTITVAKPK
jgi:hypothetical protein